MRPCPACGATAAEVLYEQRFEAFSRGSIGTGYDVVACEVCGMCFASGLPGDGRFAEYYADSSKYDDLPVDPTRFADQAAFIARHVLPTSVLDVGTATGGFLVAMRDLGYEVHGVEPSPDAVKVAQAAGLDVVQGGMREGTFGLISYVAVLEHLLDPRLRDLPLAPGGYLFVSVPDAAAFDPTAPFQEFSVEHINFFTARSLSNVLRDYTLVAQRTVNQPLGTDGTSPALEAIYRHDGDGTLQPDEIGPSALAEYIAASTTTEERVRQQIAELADRQTPLYVWGTGTHTLHLLRSSRLGECSILAFIDSNPHYAGAVLAGRPVLSPPDEMSAPILVSSAVSQSGIAAAARARFGDVPLILLYEEN